MNTKDEDRRILREGIVLSILMALVALALALAEK